MAKLRVLLADDHAVVREGLKALIDAQPDMEVVGEAADGRDGLPDGREELRPDVVVMDVSMPGLTGAGPPSDLKRDCPGRQGARPDRPRGQGLPPPARSRPGASGYVLKRAAARGPDPRHPRGRRRAASTSTRRWRARSSAASSARPRAGARAGEDELSEREAEVVRLIARGLSNKEIAAQLDLSVKTVETYKARSLEKLGLRAGRTWCATPCSGAGWTSEPAVSGRPTTVFCQSRFRPAPPRGAGNLSAPDPRAESPSPCRAAVTAPPAEQRRLGGGAAGRGIRPGSCHPPSYIVSRKLLTPRAGASARESRTNSAPRRTSSVSRPRGIDRDACRPRTIQGPQAATIHQALHNGCIMKTFALAWLPYALALAGMPSPARAADDLARDRPAGEIETVATFDGPMPTGVTVSHSGPHLHLLPEVGRQGRLHGRRGQGRQAGRLPRPGHQPGRRAAATAQHLISVQSVVVDPSDRLWAVDTGSIEFGPTSPGGPKLVCIDLESNKVSRIIPFPPEVVLPTSYINDVRFDLRRGEAGYAFLTDSSDKGPNGIIVVDLASGRSWRRLHDHPTTKADPDDARPGRGPAGDGAAAGRAAEARDDGQRRDRHRARRFPRSTTARWSAVASTA